MVNAIRNLQNGKAPGPDGFSSEFYKEFSGLLVDPLVRMFNDAFSNNELPQTLREANISVLLKKGKCKRSWQKFWPHALKVSCLKLLKRIKLVS